LTQTVGLQHLCRPTAYKSTGTGISPAHEGYTVVE